MRVHSSIDGRRGRILGLVGERPHWRIADLAAELGVSAVTVRRDVETLAEAGLLDRSHGRVARLPAAGPGRASGAGLLLGMVVPSAGYYFAEVIRGARAAAEACGARLVLGISDYSPAGDAEQVGALVAAGVQGLLLTPNWTGGQPGPAEEAWLLGLGLPVVLVERGAGPGSALAALDRVCSDHAHGAAAAVRHLAGLGHRRIALLASPGTPTAGPIGTGYRTALRALGLDEPDPVTGDGLAGAVGRGEVTAALVHTDADAIVLLRKLRAQGVRVPEELALIAYDDEIAALADVPLTAVAPPKRTIGTAALELLRLRIPAPGIGRRQREVPYRHLELLPELRIRASCGGLAVAETM
ncbi:LacI family DNA-binding transcriptional regulator [Streptacidiphilus sp. N1-12]|uniref:LacI family DNA-binding transcriptional regulator n=2 Tax=Streptacidiphilus alkalitolerans TaxID=3342712 RepID=A0ABV6V3E8_9ACTN